MSQRLWSLVALLGLIASSPLGAEVAQPAAAPPFVVRVHGSGPPMLLIPGLQSSGEVWDGVVERYADRHTLHIVTVAGFGGVPPSGEFSIARLRDGLLDYLRREKLVTPIVMGHSLGAITAYAMGAAAAPGELRAVIAVDGLPYLPALFNPAATPDTLRAEAQRMAGFLGSMNRDQLAAQADIALARMITDPQKRARAVEWARASDPGTSGRAVAEAYLTDLRADVSRITAPVLLVGAARFAAGNEAQLAGLTRAYASQLAPIPRHELVMAPGALHFVMLDDAPFLYAVIDDFLLREAQTSRERAESP